MWQYNYVQYGDVLCHHGIKGQKWGVRRYQNEDGTLTALGKKRLSKNGDITFEKGLQLYGVSNTKKPNSSSTYSPDKEGELSEKKNMKAVLLLVQQVKHLLISTLPRMILNCRPLKSRLK